MRFLLVRRICVSDQKDDADAACDGVSEDDEEGGEVDGFIERALQKERGDGEEGERACRDGPRRECEEEAGEGRTEQEADAVCDGYHGGKESEQGQNLDGGIHFDCFIEIMDGAEENQSENRGDAEQDSDIAEGFGKAVAGAEDEIGDGDEQKEQGNDMIPFQTRMRGGSGEENCAEQAACGACDGRERGGNGIGWKCVSREEQCDGSSGDCGDHRKDGGEDGEDCAAAEIVCVRAVVLHEACGEHEDGGECGGDKDEEREKLPRTMARGTEQAVQKITSFII